MKLMASMFQNMFPTINLTNVDLNNIRRCVLLNYNPASKLIDFRHYNIKVAPAGLSKGVKKVVQGKVPNLARCNDISDFFTKTAVMSESEVEDDPCNHVTLAQKLITRGNIESGKSAVRLTELGPRLVMQLIKIEDGLLDGEVLYHDLIYKTEEEKLEIQKKRELKRKLKEKRKKIQEENKRAKETKKEEHKEKSLKGMKKETESDIQMKKLSKEANKDNPTVEDDDREYYKEEVGEEPDQDMFPKKPTAVKRSAPTFHVFKNKKAKLETDSNQRSEFKHGENQKAVKRRNKFDNIRNKSDKTGFRNKTKFSNKTPRTEDRAFKSKNKFNKGKKFNKNKGKSGIDKTNSHNRDHRPIGGKVASMKSGKRKKVARRK